MRLITNQNATTRHATIYRVRKMNAGAKRLTLGYLAALMLSATGARAQVADFNGDGYADVLWFNVYDGVLGEWLVDGHSHVITNPSLSWTCSYPSCLNTWQVVGTADFNGDGYADVLWWNSSTGALSTWLLDGHGNVTSTQALSATCGNGCWDQWQPVGVGDFNGDGYADVLWYNANTGVLGQWLLDGHGNVTAFPNLSATCGNGCSNQWRIVGVGDFNGDGYADVLWYNVNNGQLGEWLLDGHSNVTAYTYLDWTCGAGCNNQWQIVGVGDFNGDEYADVLWYNRNTGVLSTWLLDGHSHVFANPNIDWTCSASNCSEWSPAHRNVYPVPQ